MKRSKHLLVPALLLATACSGAGNPALHAALSAADASVLVGEHTRLIPSFDGDEASIDGIGAVANGVAVDTPPLSRTTTFTLRVRRGQAQAEAQATVQTRYRNAFRALQDAPVAQTRHLAALLPDGRVIAAGGNTSESLNVPDSALTQIFDPATETFTRGPELAFSAEAQEFTSLVELVEGEVLLVGGGVNAGFGARTSAITQRFDPAAARFVAAGDTAIRGLSHRTATALSDGGALLTGGFGSLANSVERYDPAQASWRTAGQMLHLRALHTATLLRDGRVLIAGGYTCCTADLFSSTAEIYDPATDKFTETGAMQTARGAHAAALLPDGRVLISGGTGNDPAAPPLGTEIYHPATGRFSPGGDLLASRDSHAAVTLTDGRVLLVGGEVPAGVAGRTGVGIAATEIFDSLTGRWSEGPMLSRGFYAATVTLLGNGKVLVFGGEGAGGFPVASAALFE